MGTWGGTDMIQTLVHEIGHSLGLSHSDVREAIMAPFHKGYMPNMQLANDDIQAIQELDGAENDVTHAPPTLPPGSGNRPRLPICEICEKGSTPLDAIFMTKEKRTYVFRGDEYWELDDSAVMPGYPKRISADWGGLPGNIDTAITWKDTGATYVFKGNEYWKFINKEMKPGYPKAISEGFPGIPRDLDAAALAAANNKMYFFKGDTYWRFSERDFTIDKQGARNVQRWWYG